MTALLMLRSTIETVSAPAISPFRGSITHPTQQLCTLRGRRYRRLAQHSLPGGSLRLTWVGLAPTDRASLLALSSIRAALATLAPISCAPLRANIALSAVRSLRRLRPHKGLPSTP